MRPLAAVPGPVTSAMSVGPHSLVREMRAVLASRPDDVVELVGDMGADAVLPLVKASVPADVAGTVEIHETVAADESASTMMEGDMESTTTAMAGEMGDDMGDDMGGGMMTMQPVESVPVPAGETVELKPGGYHVMLLDVKKVLAVGDTIDVTLTFEKAGEVTTTAEVREP